MQKVKIISVSSLAAHKTASLKAQIAILGSALLPVPTIVLNGVASFSNIQKQAIDFMPILEGTLELSILQNHRIFLFLGYIAQADDVHKLTEFIRKNRHHFAGVFVDPISGDNNKPYINQKIIEAWPQLIELADFAFPNLTELKLYSGLSFEEESLLNHITAFENRFPKLDYAITSYIDRAKFGVHLKYGIKYSIIRHKYYDSKFDGTGDVFAAYYMKYHLIDNCNPSMACKTALNSTLRLIKKAIKNSNSELEI